MSICHGRQSARAIIETGPPYWKWTPFLALGKGKTDHGEDHWGQDDKIYVFNILYISRPY